MDNTLNQAKDLITSANSVIVLLPPQADVDSLAAATSLHLTLKQTKSSVLGSSSLPSNVSEIEGLSEIKKTIGNQKLVVSFDYKEENVENVSYDINESTKKFNLIIQPKAGQSPLDPSSVEFSYSGAQADLVITLGINSLEELGKIYSEEKQFLDQVKIVNINSSARPSTFATINLSLPGKTASDLAGTLLKSLELNLPSEAATNLYRQLTASTQNFQGANVDADTFEFAAYLLRHNAKRVVATKPIQ